MKQQRLQTFNWEDMVEPDAPGCVKGCPVVAILGGYKFDDQGWSLSI